MDDKTKPLVKETIHPIKQALLTGTGTKFSINKKTMHKTVPRTNVKSDASISILTNTLFLSLDLCRT